MAHSVSQVSSAVTLCSFHVRHIRTILVNLCRSSSIEGTTFNRPHVASHLLSTALTLTLPKSFYSHSLHSQQVSEEPQSLLPILHHYRTTTLSSVQSQMNRGCYEPYHLDLHSKIPPCRDFLYVIPQYSRVRSLQGQAWTKTLSL